MAIRFSCPSCQQPIEIDDNWAGQAVACPYCRRVVTAPRESSWPPANVPVATPSAGGFAPPLPPVGHPAAAYPLSGQQPPNQGGGPSSAGWALMLALFSAGLSIAGYLIWSSTLLSAAMAKVGEGASQEALVKAAQEAMLSRAAPVSPAAVTATAVGMFCCIVALVLAVRSLIRQEGKQVMAIAACLIAAFFLVCQGMLGVILFGQHAGAP